MSMKTNRDTALSTLAKRVEKCTGVETRIAYKRIGDEVESLIESLDIIPIVLIGRGDNVQLDSTNGWITNNVVETIAIPNNGDNGTLVSGTYTNTISEIQIVIISRSQVENMEIATKVLHHLYNNPKINYDVLLEPNHRIVKGAYMKLMDADEKEFSSSTNQDIPLVLTACEYQIKEQNFNLSISSQKELVPCS